MGVEQGAVATAFQHLDFFEGLGEFEFVLGFDFLADQAERVAVGDGGVVVVFVDVVAEECLGLVIADERGAGEADLDGAGVGLVEIGEKAALRVVAAVDFVEEIDALEADVVVGRADDIRVVLEFLDIDDGDFRLAGIVVDGAGGLDVAGEGLAGIDRVDDQPAAAELAASILSHS